MRKGGSGKQNHKNSGVNYSLPSSIRIEKCYKKLQ